MEKYFSLGIYNYDREKICDLYDSNVELIGQAYNIIYSVDRSGYHSLEFEIPRTIDDVSSLSGGAGADALFGTAVFGYSKFGQVDIASLDRGKNFRWNYLKSDYLIRYTCDDEEVWFVASKPSKAKAGKSIVGHVSCSGIESLLKTSNIYATFDDENGIGTIGDLMSLILQGTPWMYDPDYSDTLYESDGQTEKVRSLISNDKKGALDLIATVCGLFCARPVFDTAHMRVSIMDMQNHGLVLEGEVGRNLNALTVNHDSSNMCTRVYIEGEYGDYGYVGIDDVKVNSQGEIDDEGEPWGLPFLVDFDYYRELGIFSWEHENALTNYLNDIRQVKTEIREKGVELTECEDELNTLVGQCKFALFYKSKGYNQPAFTYGFPAGSTTTLEAGDMVVILKSNHTHTYEEWTGNPTTQMQNAYGVAKFITKAAGKIGAAEVQIEAKQKTIAQLEYKISSTTRQEKIDEYNAEIDKLNGEIEVIYNGDDDSEGLYSMMYRVMNSAGLLFELDMILDALGGLNASQEQIESIFADAMGPMLRDGYWSNQNYIPGQEKCLYADAKLMTKEMCRPKTEYTFDYVRVTEDFDIPIEDIEINGTFHIYDEELQVDDNLYIKRVSYGVDNKSLGTIEVGTQDVILTGGSFGDLLGKISNLANILDQKNAVYDRAKAINKDGLVDTSLLYGDFDTSKFNFYNSIGDWSIDSSGNFVFNSGGGGGSVMIGGGGMSVATDKDADGNWDYHPTVTPDGIDADDVNHGFLDPDRLDPTTGSRIDISDNSTINTINSNICAVSSAICVIDSNVGIISSNVGIINTNIAAVNSNINVLNSNINTVNSNINTVNSSINTINSNINTVNSNINTVNSNINTVNSNINTINSNINTVNSNINTVNSNINTINSSINTINSSINTVNSVVNTVNSTVNTVNSLINTVNSVVNTVNSTINTVNSNINTINSNINTINSAITTINSNINTINSNICTINSNICTINSNICTINSNITTINSNICTINSNICTINSSITTINSNICAVNTNISTLNLAVNAINTDISTQNFKFEGINSNITTINTNIETVNTNICTLNVVVDAINTTISTQDFKFTAINTNIQTINTDICTLNVAINSINTTISTQDFKFEGINSNITAINTDICALNVAVNAINTDISTQNFKFNAINANITTINTSIEAVNTDINTLNVAVSAINTSIETQDFKFEGINSNITAINTDISTLNLAVNSINTAISTQDFKFEGVNSSIAAINTNIETVNTNISTLNLAVNAINTDISTQNFKFDGINSSITAINADISAINSQITTINSIVYADNASICVINTHISAIDETLIAQGATIDEINSSYITIESLAHVENMDVDDLEVNTLHMFGPLYGDEIHGTFINNWDNAIEDYVVSAVRSEDGKTLTLTHASGKVINFSKATSGTVSGNWGSATFTVTGGENELATHLTNTGHWGNASNGEDPLIYYYKTFATINTSPTPYDTGNHTEINASSIHAAGYSSAQLVGTWDERTLTITKSTSGSTSLTYSVTAGHSITYNSTTHTYSGDCLARVNATTRNTLSYNSGDQAYQDGLTTGSNNVKLAESWNGRTLTVTKSTSGSNSLTYSISAGNSITYNSTSHKYTGTCNAIVGAALRSSSSYDSGDQAYQDGNTAGYGSAKLVGTWSGRTLTVAKSTSGDNTLTYNVTAGHSITYNSTSHTYGGTCNANVGATTRNTLNYDSGDQAYQDGLTIGANNVKLAGTWSGRTLTVSRSDTGSESLTYSVTAGHSIIYNSTTHKYSGDCLAKVGATTRATLAFDSGDQAYQDGWGAAYSKVSIVADGTAGSTITFKYPASSVGVSASYTYNVAVDSSYAYIMGGDNVRARIENTPVSAAYSSGKTDGIAVGTSQVGLTANVTTGVISKLDSGNTKEYAIALSMGSVNTNGSRTITPKAGTLPLTGVAQTISDYKDGWGAARSTVGLPTNGTGETMTFAYPSTSLGSSASKDYTLSIDNSYAYVKDGTATKARIANTPYTAAYSSGKADGISVGISQVGLTVNTTTGVISKLDSGDTKTYTVGLSTGTVNASGSRTVRATVTYDGGTLPVGTAQTLTDYKDAWGAARSKVQIVVAGTDGSTVTFKYPGVIVGSQASAVYNVAVDNSYAYIMGGDSVKARVANTPYANAYSSGKTDGIAIGVSQVGLAVNVTTGVISKMDSGSTKEYAITLSTGTVNSSGLRTITPKAGTLPLTGVAQTISDYQDAWGAAYSKVSLTAAGTGGSTITFKYPSSSIGGQGSYTYNLAVDDSYAYIMGGTNVRARITNTAYANGWSAARSEVKISYDGTSGSTVTFKYPTVAVGGQASSVHNVAVDNSYAYIMSGDNVRARIANTPYATAYSSGKTDGIAVGVSQVGLTANVTTGVISKLDSGNTKEYAIALSMGTVNASGSRTITPKAGTLPLTGVAQTISDYKDGWGAAYGKVSLSADGTGGSTVTFKYPGSAVGAQASYTYNVAVDNSYAYIMGGNNVRARITNTAYAAGKNAVAVTAGITYNSTSHKYVATAYKDGTSESTKSSGTEAFDAGVASVTVTAGIQYCTTTHKYTAKAYKGSAEASTITGGTEAYTAGVTAGKSAVTVTAGITYNSTSHKYTATAYKDSASADTAASGTEGYDAGYTAGYTAGGTAAGVRISGTRIERVAGSNTKYYTISAGTPSYTYDNSQKGYLITATAYADRTALDTESTYTDDTAWQYGYADGYYTGMEDYIGTAANWDSTVQYDSNNGYYIKIPNERNTGSQVYPIDATKPYEDGKAVVGVSGNGTGVYYKSIQRGTVTVYLSNGYSTTIYIDFTEV